MMPSCAQIGVPIHFHSSTTSGSASLMSLRILLRVSPRQSPSSAILFEMSSDANWPWLAPECPDSSLLDLSPEPGVVEVSIPHVVYRAKQGRPVVESRLRRYMLERKRPILTAEMTDALGVSQRVFPISGSFQPLKRKRPPG